jgi:hypothetical protein
MIRLIGLSVLVLAATASSPGVGKAALISYAAVLTGQAEAPPNSSLGIGNTQVDFDTVAHTLRVQATFAGLSGNTTASHIHSATLLPFAGTAGVATELPSFTGFPLGVKSGTYDHTFDTTQLSFYNPAFLAAHGGTAASAEAFFIQSLGNGTAYLNIHTTVVPGGEIRGFLQPIVNTEPTSLAALVGACALGLLARARWRSPRVAD